jgi:hypothetical protein
MGLPQKSPQSSVPQNGQRRGCRGCPVQRSAEGCASGGLEQIIRYPASLPVKVILPIVRLTAQLQMLRIDAQGVAAVPGDLIQASDRLRVDAQDEAGGGSLAPLEAGLATPFLLWADGGAAGARGTGWVWVCQVLGDGVWFLSMSALSTL